MLTAPKADADSSGELVTTARSLTGDLRRPRPFRYWLDLLISHACGSGAFLIAAVPSDVLPIPIELRTIAFLICVLAWYRTLAFIHEVIHRPEREMKAFRIGWNLLAGIPMCCPSFLYDTHLEHHNPQLYGTRRDGEYQSWGAHPPRMILGSLFSSFLVPGLLIIRLGLLGPLSWLFPPFRCWVERRASALVVHDAHQRNPCPRSRRHGAKRSWVLQEVATGVWIFAFSLMSAVGWISWSWLITFLAVTSCISFLNAVRTILSHRFVHEGEPLTLEEQVADSINQTGDGFWIELLYPVGLRYHALHHLAPSLPYHALAEAHRRLSEHLPPGSVYSGTNSPGIVDTVGNLWRASSQAGSRL